ncbi:hypothetical protein LIP24_10465 [Collinsella aerofaciens]|uniref:hypothetical protein n=1 Tax=Collinsella aerofaciens TaxID=74426 RepID=UPI001D021DF3|nr:hypothetical protein [Collinsella aerofaciens]MCB5367056.1 hypothetical protein [Collinsella aerofaciens]
MIIKGKIKYDDVWFIDFGDEKPDDDGLDILDLLEMTGQEYDVGDIVEITLNVIKS